MRLPRMTPPPKPCTASVSSRLSKLLPWITTSGDDVLMQYGEAQYRNTELTTWTPVAADANSSETPAPPAPPLNDMDLNQMALEEATVISASAFAGATARPSRTIRCDPVIVPPEMLAPGSALSVRSAAGLPFPAI